ncbi:MAG: SufE family protein [Alphaproteobacteria bacterium]|nr:MAG: SufE family protein [Alphaproteobacteria bacterium]
MNAHLQEIRETFALLDEWEERYRYIIELGRGLAPLPAGTRTAQNKVRGCASQVWLVATLSNDDPPRLLLAGDSDAHIVKGLIAILFAIYDGKTPREAATLDARAILDELGLAAHLSPTRANGLFAMVNRIGELARQAA